MNILFSIYLFVHILFLFICAHLILIYLWTFQRSLRACCCCYFHLNLLHSLYVMFYMSHLSCTRATSDLRPAGTTEKTTKLQQLQSNISLPITAIWKQKYQHYCETRSLLVRTASGLDFIICALRPYDDPFITPSMRLFATSRSMIALFVVCFRFLKKSKI